MSWPTREAIAIAAYEAEVARAVTLWIPGKVENPQASGTTWQKRARLARSIRERVAMHVLEAVGRKPPWPIAMPKQVTFTAYVTRPFHVHDTLPYALKPYCDALMDMGLFSPTGAFGRGNDAAHGHRYIYKQIVAPARKNPVGVEIDIRLARQGLV